MLSFDIGFYIILANLFNAYETAPYSVTALGYDISAFKIHLMFLVFYLIKKMRLVVDGDGSTSHGSTSVDLGEKSKTFV
jgi:hypothetical protein